MCVATQISRLLDDAATDETCWPREQTEEFLKKVVANPGAWAELDTDEILLWAPGGHWLGRVMVSLNRFLERAGRPIWVRFAVPCSAPH